MRRGPGSVAAEAAVFVGAWTIMSAESTAGAGTWEGETSLPGRRSHAVLPDRRGGHGAGVFPCELTRRRSKNVRFSIAEDTQAGDFRAQAVQKTSNFYPRAQPPCHGADGRLAALTNRLAAGPPARWNSHVTGHPLVVSHVGPLLALLTGLPGVQLGTRTARLRL